MSISRALMIIALVVSASCVMIMIAAGRSGSLASRLALTEPAAGVLPRADSGQDIQHDTAQKP